VLSRKGFTLFEVAISIGVAALGILALLMLLPQAIKSQEQARFGLYASTAAIDIMESFVNRPVAFASYAGLPRNTSRNRFPTIVPESGVADPWGSPTGYATFRPDIEQRTATLRNSIAPVPRVIAERLSSDNDEIAAILSAGGEIYYRHPMPNLGIKTEGTQALQMPPDAQKLVFGVVGAAQTNAIGRPWFKSWPYYAVYPHPPMLLQRSLYRASLYGDHDRWGESWSLVTLDSGNVADPADALNAVVWSTNLDPFDGDDPSGFLPYRDGMEALYDANTLNAYSGSSQPTPDKAFSVTELEAVRTRAKMYVALALWYAVRRGVDPKLLSATADHDEAIALATSPAQIRAVNALTHAGMTLTRWYPLNDPTGESLGAGIEIPGDLTKCTQLTALAGRPSLQDVFDEIAVQHPGFHPGGVALAAPGTGTDFVVTHDMLMAWHERLLEMVTHHATHAEGDWTIPRPLNRALSTDFPLIQYDVDPSGSLLSTTAIPGTSGDPNISAVSAQQWRVVTAPPVTRPGNNAYGETVDMTTISGNAQHFTLADRFAPSERCRQLVFWTVDWQSYEDVELAPSAPVDASKYNVSPYKYIDRVRPSRLQLNFTRGVMGGNNDSGDMGRTNGVCWYDRYQPLFRNPEKPYLFIRDVSGAATGDNVHWSSVGPDVTFDEGHTDDVYAYDIGAIYRRADQGYTSATNDSGSFTFEPREVFMGLYGADRNANHVLDRGTLPPSVRLHAVEVARFNLYDPRLEICFK
jgi:hypothetical protein